MLNGKSIQTISNPQKKGPKIGASPHEMPDRFRTN
uniref:Uncharacterized protein n=1 Tax=Arundo donax TaxID=35708 RepID=A0A0A9A3K7_ARUDO